MMALFSTSTAEFCSAYKRPVDLPPFERLIELLKQYHREGHVLRNQLIQNYNECFDTYFC
jgi:hypothetical protein